MSVYSQYPRGTEWRKWDLQVCTKHYTNYSGICLGSYDLTLLNTLTGIDKGKINSDHKGLDDGEYAALFVEYLIHCSEIDVVAITNHNTGKGLQEILDYLKSKQNFEDNKNIYNRLSIFPGVEIGAADKCHILIIFNPNTQCKDKFNYDTNGKIVSELKWFEFIEKFLDDIKIPHPRFTQGNKPNNSSEFSTLKILGQSDYWDFISVFPHSDMDDGLFKELQQNNRIEVYNHKNFGIVEINSSTNTDLFNILKGKKSEYGKKVIPIIKTSDASRLTEIGKEYTWIKADPTFEGLKQILYEPEDRVKIQSTNPVNEFKKACFSKIVLSKNQPVFAGKTIFFNSDEFELNQYLVTVIGGRGTGKSLLLDSIAKTFQKFRKEDRAERINPDMDFEITFSKNDGSIIDYSIRQNNDLDYLHVHQSEIKDIVEEPLRLDQEIKKMLLIKESSLKETTDLTSEQIITKIFELSSWINYENEEGKKINSVEYNQGLKRKSENLISTITTEENKQKLEKFTSNNLTITECEKLNDELLKLEESLEQYQENQNEKISAINENEIDEFKIPVIGFNMQFNAIKKITNRNNEEIKKLRDENIIIRNELIRLGINEDLSTLLDKIDSYYKELQTIDQKIDEIEEKKKEFEKFIERKNQLFLNLIEMIKNLRLNIDSEWNRLRIGKAGWNVEQKELLKKLLADINIEATIEFDYQKFYSLIYPLLNWTKFKQRGDETPETRIMNTLNVKNLFSFFSLLRNKSMIDVGSEKITLDEFIKRNYFNKDKQIEFLRVLFLSKYRNEYLRVIAKIRYKGKSPDEISIGQRGTMFICLKLATDPFVVPFVYDQPEDDLDNNFIMNELVPIFKEIKKYRQVIIVTHNANLVVNADAEQVIVANNESENISFISGSLEHTQTLNPTETNQLLKQGIREHICDILEGGKHAFESREKKYGFV